MHFLENLLLFSYNNNNNKILFANLKCSNICRAISFKLLFYTLVSCKKYTFLEKIECKSIWSDKKSVRQKVKVSQLDKRSDINVMSVRRK